MRSEPVFPSLGSTIGGVATHSYVVSDGPGASSGSLTAPMTYVAFQHPAQLPIQDEIRTIFVTGFPDNAFERELHNLCRFIPGYEASQVSFKPNQQPQVFVLFSTAAHARQALEALAGLPFDVQQPARPAATAAAATADTTATSGAGSQTGGSAAAADTLNTKGSTDSQGAASGIARLGHYITTTASGNSVSSTTNHNSNTQGNNSGNNLAGSTTQPFPSVPVLPPVKYNLRCEMAHKNLYVKDGDPSVRRPHRPIIFSNTPGVFTNAGLVAGLNSSGAITHLAPANTAAGTASYLHDVGPVYQSAGGNTVTHAVVHPLMTAATGGQAQPQQVLAAHSSSAVAMGTPLGFLPVTNRGDNPPCNTLFIGNLSDQVSEVELLHLLSSQPGYRQMKLVRGSRQVSCFVEFEDTATATAVHNAYQGAVLASSDRGGIRIQFSKNPFGRRSSAVGSSMATALRATAMGLPSSGPDSAGSAAAMASWPVVTYHTTLQQAQPQLQAQAASTGAQGVLQGHPTITYY